MTIQLEQGCCTVHHDMIDAVHTKLAKRVIHAKRVEFIGKYDSQNYHILVHVCVFERATDIKTELELLVHALWFR